MQIKDSLKKLAEEYIMNPNENKSTLFNYFCSPFLYNNNIKKNYNFANKYKDKDENNANLDTKCPFEPCKDK